MGLVPGNPGIGRCKSLEGGQASTTSWSAFAGCVQGTRGIWARAIYEKRQKTAARRPISPAPAKHVKEENA